MKLALTVFLSAIFTATLGAQVGGELTTYFHYEGGSTYDNLGIAVAGVGDLDGDTITDFMYSADQAEPGGIYRPGSVWVHSGASGAVLFRFDGDFADRLGGSLGEVNLPCPIVQERMGIEPVVDRCGMGPRIINSV